MVRQYEAMFVVNPNLEEEGIKALIDKFKEIINSSGTVESVEEWGKRKLAYPINKVNEGFYTVINFSAEPSFAHELERIFKITDGVLKYLIINKNK